MIDPMHNLLLGSAKTFVKLWKQTVTDSSCYEKLQQSVDQFIIPAGVGRIPKLKVSFPISKQSYGKTGF